MTSLLTLDLASRTGWAACSPDRQLACGSVQMPKTGEDVGRFLDAYEQWFSTALDECLPQYVIFEAPILPSNTSLYTVRKLTGLANSTELISYRRGICYREAHQQTVRLHFCGHGQAPKIIKGRDQRRKWMKAKMIEACQARGWNPANDDEADALGVLDYAAACLEVPGLPEGPLFKDRAKIGDPPIYNQGHCLECGVVLAGGEDLDRVLCGDCEKVAA